MVIGLQIWKLHRGGGIRPLPPAVLDSKKPGLFRVKMMLISILETAKRKLTEKLFSSDEIAGPHRPMVEISSAPQTVFISISVTRKGHFEA